MATPKLMVAVKPFVAIVDGIRYRHVAEGERLPVTDPLVKANPGLFEPLKS